jgi:hypothetical protein
MIKRHFLLFMTLVLVTGCERILIGPQHENTPEGNLNYLWRTIDEKYSLFPISHVNWDSLYNVSHSMIDGSITDSGLWAVCCQMLSPLNNGHLELVNEDFTLGFCPVMDYYDRNTFSIDLVRREYLVNSVVAGEGNLISGRIRNTSLGYLYIRSFSGAANGRDWIRDMDNVIRDLLPCDGIIIDIRNNGGGLTRNDLYAASFFIDREITYYYSKVKIGPGHNDFSEAMPKKIFPRDDGIHYTKQNVVLTNRFSASGSEAFTLILKNMPGTTQIGDTTRGAIGEVTHVAQLPVGWKLYYPCTLTLLGDGTSPEGVGIIPDILINNAPDDINSGKDRVIELAIDYLTDPK